jgi:hypothetical protein
VAPVAGADIEHLDPRAQPQPAEIDGQHGWQR